MEILFVPGMVLGFISVALMLAGVIFSFKDYGTAIGIITLVATGVSTTGAVYWAFSSSLWKKLQVKTRIDGHASAVIGDTIKIGDVGKTISRLNPTGKALINNIQVEVQVMENFIDQENEIEVIKIQSNKIWVKIKP
jgi:membrane-bound ClpP family serine protease